MKSDRTRKRDDRDFKCGLALYLGLACFCTFLINLICEPMAFRNLNAIRLSPAHSQIRLSKSGYLGSQIIVPDLFVNISKMGAWPWWAFLSLVAAFSIFIGVLAYALRDHTKAIGVPIGLYFIGTLVLTKLNPAAFGTILTATSYIVVYFTARGIREFNPHWDLQEKGLLNEGRRSALSTMFFQYTAMSIGAIAFIALACLFKSAPLVRSALGAIGTSGVDSAVIRGVEVPFVIATTLYALFGCVAVAWLITRELHIKSHELIVMPDSPRIVDTSSDLPLQQKEQ